MAQAQGFVSQDKQNGNSRWGLEPQPSRGGSCYLRCGPGAMSTSLYELHEKVSNTDASEQKNSKPFHVPLCDDMLLSESQYALAHPLQCYQTCYSLHQNKCKWWDQYKDIIFLRN